MSTYGWIVTHDYVTTNDGSNLPTRKGWTGPSDITPELEARLQRGEGFKWRCLYDGEPGDYDDEPHGAVAYKGRIVFADPEVTCEEYTPNSPERFRGPIAQINAEDWEAFGPLNDLAMPDAGAAHIEYRVTHHDADGSTTKRVWAEL